MARSSSLKPADIHEYNRRDHEFNRVFDYAKSLNFPVYPVSGVPYPLYRAMDFTYWKALDVYLYRNSLLKGKLSKHDIYHPCIHYLLVKAFADDIVGLPRFTLLCEVIATSIEFYFTLRDFSLTGKLRTTETEVLGRYVAGQMIKNPSRPRAEKLVSEKINQALADPFAAVKKCISNGYEVYRGLWEFSVRRSAGLPFAPASFKFIQAKRDYDFVILSYNFGANILYVRAYCGEPRQADEAAVADCLALVDRSESFLEFFEGLQTLAAEREQDVQRAA